MTLHNLLLYGIWSKYIVIITRKFTGSKCRTTKRRSILYMYKTRIGTYFTTLPVAGWGMIFLPRVMITIKSMSMATIWLKGLLVQRGKVGRSTRTYSLSKNKYICQCEWSIRAKFESATAAVKVTSVSGLKRLQAPIQKNYFFKDIQNYI